MTKMKIIALVVLLSTSIQDGHFAKLESSPSYAVIRPGQDTSVPLRCRLNVEEGDVDPGEDIVYTWLNPDNFVWAFKDTYQDSRVTSSWSKGSNEMILDISSVALTDDGVFSCQVKTGAISYKTNVKLSVNQFPTKSLQKETDVVLEGKMARVATCYANLSKPAPEMWFEDSAGKRIETSKVIEHNECDNGLTNSTLYLERTFHRSDSSETFFCRIKHVNQSTPSALSVGKIDVKYAPVVSFIDEEISTVPQIHKEGTPFSVGCEAKGFPNPTITWAFIPAVSAQSIDNESDNTEAKSFPVPSNFIITDGGSRIITTSLKVADASETNNGMFVCQATNEIGSDRASFTLEVSEIPTTTPAPTTAVWHAEETTKTSELVTEVLLLGEGPDMVLIMIIVAAAILILVVAVILLLRYFMLHKGEYYTHELKVNDDVKTELSQDAEDDFPETEADLMCQKKRTEHFL